MLSVRDERKNLVLFFVLAFAISWVFWIIEILWKKSLFLGPFGPTIAAFVLTYINEGAEGAKKLLKRGIDLKFKKIWLIPIFLLMPCIIGLSLVLAVLAGDTMPEFTVLAQPWIIPIAFLYIFFLGGPLCEEFGWRGYAQDRLQKHFNALVSGIILGVIWGLWHIPLFFMENQDIYRNVPIWGFILGTVFLSILFTWIYNNTGGSILAVMLFHTMGNLSHFVIPAMYTTWGGLFSVILNIIVVVIIVIIWGYRKMVREGGGIQILRDFRGTK
ncbi:MAG: CPBP family intramembrane metalloprotease [Thermoplasmata archaeon]|nr:CPBP family intramembrane metalloprotease [Thermoplasmata archaeon]